MGADCVGPRMDGPEQDTGSRCCDPRRGAQKSCWLQHGLTRVLHLVLDLAGVRNPSNEDNLVRRAAISGLIVEVNNNVARGGLVELLEDLSR